MELDRADLSRFDLEPLARAIRRVEKALRFSRSDLATDPELAEEFRQSTIQTFEFTYELTLKSVVRFLRYLASINDPEKLSFQQLIRVGLEQGLFASTVDAWLIFRTMRNRSSHAYDENTAREVYAVVPTFLAEASHTLAALRRRIADEQI